MAKYSVSCKINYDPARVFDWAAKLEQQKRARIPFSINPADIDRKPPTEHALIGGFTVIKAQGLGGGGSGGYRRGLGSHPGTPTGSTHQPAQLIDPTTAAAVAEAVTAGAGVGLCDGSGPAVDRVAEKDVLQWGDWLARPFPEVIQVFQQDDVDITLITDLMAFTEQQVGPLVPHFPPSQIILTGQPSEPLDRVVRKMALSPPYPPAPAAAAAAGRLCRRSAVRIDPIARQVARLQSPPTPPFEGGHPSNQWLWGLLDTV